MRVQFVGCGDAFGSGGRFNTCFHVTAGDTRFLIDCGASSMVGMKRLGIDPDAIDAILISHFHADHFGGIPPFVLHGQFASGRRSPLLIAGPPGLPGWFEREMETAFPGSSGIKRAFGPRLHEFEIGRPAAIGPARVTPFHVSHDDRAGPCLGFRIELEGRVLAFSGDTEWNDALIEIGRDADLFICECYSYERPVPKHMSLAVLNAKLDAIRPKRMILTHMSEDMLSRRDEVPHELAEDGLLIEL